MKKSDFEALYQSSYDRKELVWIILTCLDYISDFEKGEDSKK